MACRPCETRRGRMVGVVCRNSIVELLAAPQRVEDTRLFHFRSPREVSGVRQIVVPSPIPATATVTRTINHLGSVMEPRVLDMQRLGRRTLGNGLYSFRTANMGVCNCFASHAVPSGIKPRFTILVAGPRRDEWCARDGQGPCAFSVNPTRTSILVNRGVSFSVKLMDQLALRKFYATVWNPWTLMELLDKKRGAISSSSHNPLVPGSSLGGPTSRESATHSLTY